MKSIITISREFGSGGRSIGKDLAKKLGYAYYDKDLVKRVAQETGFDPSYIEEAGEYAPGKSMLSYAFSSVGPQNSSHMGGMSASDYLWSTQSKIIRDIAEKGHCVIVGRCADFILKDRDDCMNIFIHADMAFKEKRIVELYGVTDKSPKKRLEEKDAKRRVNYKFFTGREWGNAANYHLTLDSGFFKVENCADIILKIEGE